MNDRWTIVGVLVLGAGLGALVTWIALSAQIRKISRLLKLMEAESKYSAQAPHEPQSEQLRQDHKDCKSA